jgi:hypothetical protein
MSLNIFLQYVLPVYLVELAGALACVFLCCWLLLQRPGSVPSRFLLHPQRIWFALGLFILPRVLSHLYLAWRLSHLHQEPASAWVYLPIGMALAFVHGVIYGLVGCLLSVAGGKPNRGKAMGITVGAIIFALVLGTLFRMGSFTYVADIMMALVFLIFVAAQKRVVPQAGQVPDEIVIAGKKVPPIFALALAFLPSALFLSMWTMLSDNAGGVKLDGTVLVVCCLISVFCCFAASFMLFRRGTGWAIFGGAIFMLLNAFVSFLFGCGAILSGMKF